MKDELQHVHKSLACADLKLLRNFFASDEAIIIVGKEMWHFYHGIARLDSVAHPEPHPEATA